MKQVNEDGGHIDKKREVGLPFRLFRQSSVASSKLKLVGLAPGCCTRTSLRI